MGGPGSSGRCSPSTLFELPPTLFELRRDKPSLFEPYWPAEPKPR
jgi:hypothetical protein